MKLLHIAAVIAFLGNITTGILAAIGGGFPILRTGWIAWTLALFGTSGLIFMFLVALLQRQLLALAQADGAGGFDHAAYHRLAQRWEIRGATALVTPVAGLVLMVLKPALVPLVVMRVNADLLQ
jgi:uncharacterized membrane protein